jgi:hypothetical protein
MAIRNLKPVTISDFEGKNTQQNLVDAPPGLLNIAKNVMIQNDRQISKAPGYTKVATLGTGPVRAIYDFTRGVDGAQFVIVQSGSEIYAMQADGSGSVLLSSGEGAVGFRFVNNNFNCYGSDGVNAYRFVDTGSGGLTKYTWGISSPPTAPTIATGAGTLTLENGVRYVRCYVSRYTDSLGIQRLHISAPSAMSAHTGPLVSRAITVGGLTASTDAQVNYQWIFRTTDSPLGTTATFYFIAEIPNAQSSWGDALTDDSLDLTRLAPDDNNPAPPSPNLCQFQNRVVAMSEALIQLSGYGEINIGIPEEAWPTSLFFNLPGGKPGTCIFPAQDGTVLLASSRDYWYSYKGYDAVTFTEQDKVASPGAAGRDAICETPFGIAWLAPSKRIWLWNGTSDPTDISSVISNSMTGTYGMDDLSAADLATAQLKWFSFGSTHFVALFCRTSDAPDANFNLIQLWNVGVATQASSGQFGNGSTVYGQISGIYQTDKIPSVSMTATGAVLVNSVPYIYCGDAAGNVYRFPDGFVDNTVPMISTVGTGWMGDPVRKKYYFVDVVTNRNDALGNIKIMARVADSPDQQVIWMELPTQVLPSPNSSETVTLRGNLQLQGTAVGRYIAVGVVLPSLINEVPDTLDAIIRQITVYSKPLFVGVP